MNVCKISFKNSILAIWNQLTSETFLSHIMPLEYSASIAIFLVVAEPPKIPYPNKKVALRAAEAMGKKHGVHFSIYKCAWCDGWHIGKNAQNKIKGTMHER